MLYIKQGCVFEFFLLNEKSAWFILNIIKKYLIYSLIECIIQD